MTEIEIFLQGDGIKDITLVRVPRDSTVQSIIEAATAHGLPVQKGDSTLVVFKEDEEEPLDLDATLEAATIGDRARIHVHRCRRVEISVNFNGVQKGRRFAPAATMLRVKHWADREFGLKGVDATDHVLQLCGATTQPDEDTHVGSLVTFPRCVLCFDLVPKERVEG